MPDRKDGRTLLLVEDDYQMRLLLTMVLGNMGYDITVAEDGFSALRKLRDMIPAIILSDLNMPGMSGFEFLSVVRRRFQSVRVIAMSGAYEERNVPPGVAADGFYQKGNDLDELLELLEPSSTLQKSGAGLHSPGLLPVWISNQQQDGDGTAYVTISCPECLRNFRETHADRLLN